MTEEIDYIGLSYGVCVGLIIGLLIGFMGGTIFFVWVSASVSEHEDSATSLCTNIKIEFGNTTDTTLCTCNEERTFTAKCLSPTQQCSYVAHWNTQEDKYNPLESFCHDLRVRK